MMGLLGFLDLNALVLSARRGVLSDVESLAVVANQLSGAVGHSVVMRPHSRKKFRKYKLIIDTSTKNSLRRP